MLTEIQAYRAHIRAPGRMKPGGVTERRRGFQQARINAKHDMASAIERLARTEGAPPAYVAELKRWLRLLGYRLDAPE